MQSHNFPPSNWEKALPFFEDKCLLRKLICENDLFRKEEGIHKIMDLQTCRPQEGFTMSVKEVSVGIL